jgi:hypothetical protein|tara:strand:- start:119 stop:424 length:306 start_codon:yes stop_codon:yes gene_type:complete
VSVPPNELARRSYFCGLKVSNGLRNKVVICDLETSIENHASDSIFHVWEHAGYPEEQKDIANDLDLDTRAKMKIDCFQRMMQEAIWSSGDNFRASNDDLFA